MKDKYIPPLNDVVFSYVFGTQANIENTRDFLKSLLDIPEEEFERLTVKNSVLKPTSLYGKTSVVDVVLSTTSGKIIQIEMQVDKTSDLRDRILYYATKLFDRQLLKGQKYGMLKQVISVVICDHKLLDEEEHYLNVYGMLNERSGRPFTDKLKVVIIELPKVPNLEDGPLWAWLKFLSCDSKEECRMLVKRHPELRKAAECAQRVSFIERLQWTFIILERRRSEYRQYLEDVRNEGLASGHAEGHAKGHAEGQTEKSLEIARRMKAMGLPNAQIAEGTGLSPETVEQL